MRYEIKYIVHRSKLDRLRSMMQPFVNVDRNARDREDSSYTVRSLYFDTPDLLYYYEKIEGVPHRLKLRMRTYNRPEDKAPLFFEIKRKHQIPMTKNRAPYPFETALNILSHGLDTEAHRQLDPRKNEECQRFLFHLQRDHLCPTVLVVYDREPFESITDRTVRITFDKNLRSALEDSVEDIFSQELKEVMQEHFILEVKYNRSYPHWMQAIVNSLDLKQTSASKYCMCMENHPEVFKRDQWAKVVSFRHSLDKRA